MTSPSLGRLNDLPSVELAHKPTPIEEMRQLSDRIGGARLFVKRDDCTGLAFGGNKIRQLEFYFGEAASQSADLADTLSAKGNTRHRRCVSSR